MDTRYVLVNCFSFFDNKDNLVCLNININIIVIASIATCLLDRAMIFSKNNYTSPSNNFVKD